MPDEKQDGLELPGTEKMSEGEAIVLPRPRVVSPLPHDASDDVNPSRVARHEQITITTVHQGQLPPAEYLREINEIVPNGAERIMAMAEGHAAHSQMMDKLELEALIAHDKGELARSNRGLFAGFIVSMSFGLGSLYLIATGHEVPGTIFGTVDIVALASVFVIGRVYSKDPPKASSVENKTDEPEHESRRE